MQEWLYQAISKEDEKLAESFCESMLSNILTPQEKEAARIKYRNSMLAVFQGYGITEDDWLDELEKRMDG